ncbi:CYTH domain containing protein [Novymonas esmeraldas]|uniref:CYTH domain containing protein n=1 Tax=Novymonas esmeraldas TaxID=1808958 RepID=A0AAW0ER59_9TRYP
MQIEVKLSLDGAEGYQRCSSTLANHRVKEECYYDVFFDFPYHALQERNNVLRLRVQCDPASVQVYHTDTAASPLAVGVKDNYDPDAEYEALLRSCRREAHPPSTSGDAGATVAVTAADPASAELDSNARRPRFLAGATGKLVFKSVNRVESGDQTSFVDEDPQVPPDVVEDLLRLVPESLFRTGDVSASSAPYHAEDAFARLSAYARRQQRERNSAGDSAVARILAQLRSIASAYAAAESDAVSLEADKTSSNVHYTQVRFAAMGPNALRQRSVTVQKRPRDEGNGADTAADADTGAVAVAAPRLEVVAGYTTLRKVYTYAPLLALQGGETAAQALSERDREFREKLRVRLDASYFLGRHVIYELEVPECGAYVGDIKAEACQFLSQLGVPFSSTSESKFQRYAQYVAATRTAEQDASDVKLRLSSLNGYEEVLRHLPELIGSTVAPAATSTAAAADAASRSPHNSQERRYVSNTEVRPVSGVAGDDDGDVLWHTDSSGYLQETNEDVFFDDAGETLRRRHSFLRLRTQAHARKHFLTLKAHQVFKDGQQSSLTTNVGVSETVALALLSNPTQFLHDYAQKFAVVQTLWHQFGMRELRRTAAFTTERLTVPWWTSRVQPSTMQRSWSAAAPSTNAPQSQPIYTSASYFLSQQQQQQPQQCRDDGTTVVVAAPVAAAAAARVSPLVPPLLLHLDKTVYKLTSSGPRVPFSQTRSWGERRCEMYEIEVTNIAAPTDPRAVVEELTFVLQGLGVEWTVGVRSKLEQHFFLAEE